MVSVPVRPPGVFDIFLFTIHHSPFSFWNKGLLLPDLYGVGDVMNQNTVREVRDFPGRRRDDRLAVILAGGDGSRLQSLTKMITGDERPKQFCPIRENRTLLDETRDRVEL